MLKITVIDPKNGAAILEKNEPKCNKTSIMIQVYKVLGLEVNVTEI